jgi:hypothetical protein
MKMEQTVCSETLAFKLQMPGNNPEESTRHPTSCFATVESQILPSPEDHTVNQNSHGNEHILV